MPKKSIQSSDTWSKRVVKRLDNPKVKLEIYRENWEADRNPTHVWHAIPLCNGEPLPIWIRKYLQDCADRIHSPEVESCSDIRKILPKVFGFSAKRGQTNLLRPEGVLSTEKLLFAARFARRIADNRSPPDALRDATEVLPL